jgi:putative DNA primase/helicase
VAKFDDPKSNGTGMMVRCPCYEDRKLSLHVSIGSDGRVVTKCHSGCKTSDILKARGLTYEDLFPPTANGSAGKRGIFTAYSYVRDGVLLCQSVREQFPSRKTFFARRPSGDGGRISNLQRIDPPLYRIDDLRKQPPSAPILELVGEKDVDRANREGSIATINILGKGEWKAAYSTALAARPLVVMPDHDEAGYRHALDVVQQSTPHAAKITIIRFTDEPPKGDFSD